MGGEGCSGYRVPASSLEFGSGQSGEGVAPVEGGDLLQDEVEGYESEGYRGGHTKDREGYPNIEAASCAVSLAFFPAFLLSCPFVVRR